MDAGIIKNVKHHYRGLVTEKFLEGIASGEETTISIRDGIEMLVDSWEKVSADTITNSFRNAGLFHDDDECFDYEFIEDDAEESFVVFDDGTVTSRFLSDEEIIEKVSLEAGFVVQYDDEEFLIES